MTEKESLSQLERRAEKFPSAITSVEEKLQNLPSVWPKNQDYSNLSLTEKVAAIKQAVEDRSALRKIITENTIPNLRSKYEELLQRITQINQLGSEIEGLRQYLASGDITQEEFNGLMNEYEEILNGKKPEVVTQVETEAPVTEPYKVPEELHPIGEAILASAPLRQEPTVTEQAAQRQAEVRRFARRPVSVDIELPNGEVQNINGEAIAETLKALLEAENYSLTSEEAALKIYGVDTRVTRGAISRNISGLKEQLAGAYEIIQPVTLEQRAQGAMGVYTLKKIEEQAPVVVVSDADAGIIADLQRQVNRGILTNPDLIAKVKKQAEEMGITFNVPESIKLTETPKLTPDLALSLVGLIKNIAKRGTVIKVGEKEVKFEIAPDTNEIFEKLIDKYVPVGEELNGQYTALRVEALDMVEKIMNSEDTQALIDAHEEEIKFLLEYVACPDQMELGKVMIELLRSNKVEFVITESRESRGFVARIEQATIKLTEKEEPVAEEIRDYRSPFVLPDGKEINNLFIRERDIAEVLKNAFLDPEDKKVSGTAVVRRVWGEEVDMKVGKGRLSATLSPLRRKLLDENWDWDSEKVGKEDSLYFLKKVEKEPADQSEAALIIEEETGEKKETLSDVTGESEELAEEEVASNLLEKPQAKVRETTFRVATGSPPNTKRFEKDLSEINFRLVPGGNDLRILDWEGKYVASVPHRAGGRTISVGVYNRAVRNIKARLAQLQALTNLQAKK